MKKSLYTAALLLLSSSVFAQMGITAGMNLSKYHFGEKRFEEDRKQILTGNVGLQYKKIVTEKLFLLPELGYTQKGTTVYYSYPIGYTGPMKIVNRLNYIQLTLPAYLTLPLSDEYDFEIAAGPYLAYLLGATQKTVEFDDSSTKDKFAEDAFKKTDIGLHLATGLRLGKKLGMHFRYDLGLININGIPNTPSVLNRNFSINMSWIFAHND